MIILTKCDNMGLTQGAQVAAGGCMRRRAPRRAPREAEGKLRLRQRQLRVRKLRLQVRGELHLAG